MTSADHTATGRIVVGVDGSTSSRLALRWAARQADLTGAHLRAVACWSFPDSWGFAPMAEEEPDWAGIAEQTLENALSETLDAAQLSKATRQVEQGHPARALVEAADGADLVAVGSRGHGGFVGLLLGSVAQYVATHATCPVVVVHDHPDEVS